MQPTRLRSAKSLMLLFTILVVAGGERALARSAPARSGARIHPAGASSSDETAANPRDSDVSPSAAAVERVIRLADYENADSPPPASPAAPAPAAAPAKSTGFYREAGSYGTTRETVPPKYVRNLSKTGIPGTEDITWLDVGLDFRTRWEYRENDLRREEALTDNPFLFRTRGYIGIRDIFDPFRFVIEVEDARRYNSKFPKDNRDFNEFEPIQLIAEIYLKDALGVDALGQDRPLSLRGGRMWFEMLDRRLIGNNAWRNTTNTFQGLHVSAGREVNDWQLDGIAAQPLLREMFEFDSAIDGQYFFAVVGHWRKWSDVVTLEPYYLLLSQRAKEGRSERLIHAPALRFYGPIGTTGFDYDFDLVYQFGEDNQRDHEAFGASNEIGYRFKHPWKPRVSAFYGYASGDRDPNDDQSERFERFFGFARPWSGNDYFIWENFHTPKVKLEIEPIKGLRIDTGYGAFWLASDKDRVANFNLRDPSGQSGDFVGQEFDFRARYPIGSRIDATFGYARFNIGNFVRNTTEGTGRDKDTNFFYIELMMNAFPRG